MNCLGFPFRIISPRPATHLGLAALALLASLPAKAAPAFTGNTVYWTGSVSTDWYDPANWFCPSTDCLPDLPLEIPAFSSSATRFEVNHSRTSDVPRSLTVLSGTYRFTGNPLRLQAISAGGTAGAHQFDIPIRFNGGAGIWMTTGGSAHFNQAVQLGLGQSGPLYIESSGTLRFNAPVSGPGGLTLRLEAGVNTDFITYTPGRVLLEATNTFTGRIQVDEGFLVLTPSGTLGDLSRETTIGPRGQLILSRPGVRSAESLFIQGEGPTFRGNPVGVPAALVAESGSHQLLGPIGLEATAALFIQTNGTVTLNNSVSAAQRSHRLLLGGPGTLALEGTAARIDAPLELRGGTLSVNARTNPLVARFSHPIHIGGFTNEARLDLSPSGALESDSIPGNIPVTVAAQGRIHLGQAREAIERLRLLGGTITGTADASLGLGDRLELGGTNTALIDAPTRLHPDATLILGTDDAIPAVDLAGRLSGGALLIDGPTVELRGTGQNQHALTHLRSGLLRLDKAPGATLHRMAAGPRLIVGLHDPDAPAASVRCQDTNQFHPNDAVAEIRANGTLFLRDFQALAGLTLAGGTVSNGILRLNGPLTIPSQPRSSTLATDLLRLAETGITFDCTLDSAVPIALDLRTPVEGGPLAKSGNGLLQLSGAGTHASNAVLAGSLVVLGDHATVPTHVAPDAEIAGSGSVGPLSLAGNARIRVGSTDSAPATFTTGNLTLAGTNEVLATIHPDGHDRLRVNGTVNLGTASRLNLLVRRKPNLNEAFVLLQNDGTDPISGSFANLQPNTTHTNQNLVFSVHYDGGTGNDLALRFIGEAGTTTNRPPTFGPLPTLAAVEGTPLTVAIPASDPDPGQALRFTAPEGLPPGASLNRVSGLLSWSPGERQGGRTFDIRLRVTDDALPSLSAEAVLTINVAETNTPPILADPGPIQVQQGESLSLRLEATDPDVPVQALSFQIVSGAPNGLSINPGSGRLQWSPDPDLPSSSHAVLVRVQDGAGGSAARTLNLSYVSLNRAPVPAATPDILVPETTGWFGRLAATDPETPANQLSWEFASPVPPWLTLDAAGNIGFFESEEAGPSTNTIVARVLDNGSPRRSATVQFQLVVTEANRAPSLAYPVTPILAAGEVLSLLPVTLSDPDLPTQPLRLQLRGTPPSGLQLEPTTGRLTWTVPANQPPSTNQFSVVVTDDPGPTGTPLSRTNVVTVVTRSAAPVQSPTLSATLRPNGDVEIAWASAPGTTYRIQSRPAIATGSWNLLETIVATETRTSVRIRPESTSALYRILIPD